MLRGISFCICISVMLSLFAQNEESNFIAPDRTIHKRSEIIKRAIKKFLDFSDFDTAYISPNRYNYALMLDHFTNYEYYSVGCRRNLRKEKRKKKRQRVRPQSLQF